MATYNVHGGHNSIIQGANSEFGKEHVLDRQVKDLLIAKLRSLGHTVYDCTDEVGTTQNMILKNIVAKCNAHKVDLDISLHLNAFNGSANGVEVCYYDQEALAAKISKQLSTDIGWFNRGAKLRQELYVLSNTSSPALLIEMGFIDNAGDMAKWNSDKIADSICFAITGKRPGGSTGGGGNTGGGSTEVPSDGRYGTLTVTGDVVNIRKGPGTDYSIATGTGYQGDGKARAGESYVVWGEQNGWYNVGGDAWIIGTYVNFTKAPQAPKPKPPVESVGTTYYRVIAASVTNRDNLQGTRELLYNLGIDTFVATFVKDGVTYYRLIAGSYTNRQNADDMLALIKKHGVNGFIEAYTA